MPLKNLMRIIRYINTLIILLVPEFGRNTFCIVVLHYPPLERGGVGWRDPIYVGYHEKSLRSFAEAFIVLADHRRSEGHDRTEHTPKQLTGTGNGVGVVQGGLFQVR